MFWKKKVAPQKKRLWKELLRENLGTFVVDMFYPEDPLIKLNDAERKVYLRKFHTLLQDKDVMDRIKYLINKQANLTLKSMNQSDDEQVNMAGAMNINGIGVVKDDFERLATMYLKEDDPPEKFDKFSVY